MFEWRPAQHQHKRGASQRALVWIVCALVLVTVAYSCRQFWLLFSGNPELAAKLKALTWQDFIRPIFQVMVEMPLFLLAAVAVLWVQRRLRGSRLYLSRSQLRHSNGLPLWLGNLLKQNWTLALDERMLRFGKLVLACLRASARSAIVQANPKPDGCAAWHCGNTDGTILFVGA